MACSCEEEIEDLTTCSVCFLGFDVIERKPKFLPCSHTFCLSCLKAMSEKQDEELVCPNCRKPFSIPSPEVLPNNMYALQLIKMNKIMTDSQQLLISPRWCLTCQSIAKEACLNNHSTLSLAEDGKELQKKMEKSENSLNEALEKRAKIQIHLDSVLKSLKETKHSIKKEAEENSEHTISLMTALENIDKLKNAKEDVSGAREKIESVFQEAEKELKLATETAIECEDQTEVRIWISKPAPSGKSCFTIPKPPVLVTKATETKRICPSETKEKIICGALNPIKAVLACGLESGKLCLFQSDCSLTPFSDWSSVILESLSTQPILCIDWDVNGIRFALGFADGLVQVWSVEGVKSFEHQVHSTTISKMSWNREGAPDLFFTCTETSVAICSSALLEKIVHLFTFESAICEIVWVKADSFVCFNEDNEFEMYQIGKEVPVRTFIHDDDDTLRGLCWMGRLASSSDEGFIKIWSLEEDESLFEYATDSPVFCIDWCPTTTEAEDSGDKDDLSYGYKLIASGEENGLVQIWNTANEEENDPLKTLDGHTKPVASVSFSPDGKFLASMSDSTNLIVWYTKSWDKIYENEIGEEDVSNPTPCITWTSSNILAIASKSREVTILEFD